MTTGGKGGVQGVITSSDAGDKGFAAGGKRGVKGEIISSAESEEEGVKGCYCGRCARGLFQRTNTFLPSAGFDSAKNFSVFFRISKEFLRNALKNFQGIYVW